MLAVRCPFKNGEWRLARRHIMLNQAGEFGKVMELIRTYPIFLWYVQDAGFNVAQPSLLGQASRGGHSKLVQFMVDTADRDLLTHQANHDEHRVNPFTLRRMVKRAKDLGAEDVFTMIIMSIFEFDDISGMFSVKLDGVITVGAMVPLVLALKQFGFGGTEPGVGVYEFSIAHLIARYASFELLSGAVEDPAFDAGLIGDWANTSPALELLDRRKSGYHTENDRVMEMLGLFVGHPTFRALVTNAEGQTVFSHSIDNLSELEESRKEITLKAYALGRLFSLAAGLRSFNLPVLQLLTIYEQEAIAVGYFQYMPVFAVSWKIARAFKNATRLTESEGKNASVNGI